MSNMTKEWAVRYIGIGEGTLIYGSRNDERLRDTIQNWPKELYPNSYLEVLINGECLTAVKLEDVKDRDIEEVIKEIGL